MCPEYWCRCATLLFLAATALATPAADAQLPVIRPQQRLPMPPQSAPRPTAETTFGELAVTDGRTIIVTVASGPAAYAYVKDATGRWAYESALVAPDGNLTSIGASVRGNVAALEGSNAVGEPFVFVFVRAGGQWTHTQTLPGPGAINRANHVALGGDYLALGDIGANGFAGAVHIYDEAGPGTYVFNTDLSAAGSVPGWLVGYHLIADGDTVLAAAPGNELVAGFARAGGVWSEQGQLNPDGINFFWFFGVSGNRAVLTPLGGNPEEFVRRDGTWQKRGLLIHPSDPQRQLRNPIAVGGRRLLVGEQGSENALLFELQDGTWRATGALRNANDAACPALTDSGTISLVGTLALAACPRVPRPDHDFEGRVLVYELPPLQ